MDARDTLSALARQIALAFQPLADAFSSAGALRDFLEEFGWDFTAVPPPLDAVPPVQDLYALADRPEGLNEGDVAQVVLKLRAAFQAITDSNPPPDWPRISATSFRVSLSIISSWSIC